MKNSGILISAMLLVILIISCSKNSSEKILGEWKVTDIATSEDISMDVKKALMESFEETKKTSLLTFNADGTFNRIIAEESIIGKWVLSTDAKSLTLTYPDGKSEVLTVFELTDSKLVVVVKMNDMEYTNTYEKVVNEKKK
jgi:hypothetical protein